MLYDVVPGRSWLRTQKRSWAKASGSGPKSWDGHDGASVADAAVAALVRELCLVEAGGEAGDCGCVEEVAERQIHAEVPPQAGDDLCGEQGVASQLEERVVHPEVPPAQHLGPYLHYPGLGGGAGGERGIGGRLGGGRGQGSPVELSVDGAGQGVDDHEGGGNEVSGQHLPQPGPQSGGGGRWVVAHHVGDQPQPGAVVTGHHRRLTHPGAGGHRCLGLGRLDPKAPDLDLLVEAPQKLQRPLGAAPDPVSGAVHAGAGRAEGVGDEPLRRQCWAAVVAPGQARPAQVQLTHRLGGQGAQPVVEDVGLGAGKGVTDGGGAGSAGASHATVE